MATTIDSRSFPIHFIPTDQVGAPRRLTVDVDALRADLQRTVRGEVRFDAASRGLYAQDASNYRMVPLGVVLPHDDRDVVNAVAAARKHGAPIHMRGGGTGIPGQTVNDGLLIEFSKYMRHIDRLEPSEQWAWVQPGVVLDELRDAAKPHGLTFGPDPATHSRCTLGGMLGNNSCGIHSVMAGRTADNVEELDILLYDGTRIQVGRTSEDELEEIVRQGGRKGEIYGRLRALRDKYADLIRERYPKIPRRVSGYNLDELLPENGFHVARALVGSEGTCALILKARLQLVHNPPVRSLLVLGFPDVFTAGDHVMIALKHHPVGLEGMDDSFMEDMTLKGMHDASMDLMPKGRGWLLVEFGGETKQESDDKARRLMDECKKLDSPPSMKLFDDPFQEKHIWHLREEGLGATAFVPGKKENHEGWEDSAVPPEKVGGYLRDFKKLLDKYGYEGALYGHFGDGCIHTRLDFELQTADGIEHYREYVQEAADLVVHYGGSLSGEHGDGQARGELLTRMFGEELIEAFREFKSIWDPDWKMNPGKLIAPYRNDENLTLGTHFHPDHPSTHFQYPDDKHSFSRAVRRCVGAGVCRRKEGGTMCPSYMVTLEEKHCTRGRARLLFEMLQGDVVKDGWKSEEVKESLDLCLSCKGCKGDCPVQVDMATYKSEFLAHYYEGKPRPRNAFAFGFIHWWSRIASLMPGVVNLVNHAPLIAPLMKRFLGIEARRNVPSFAPYTFKSWFKKRSPRNDGKPQVILWPDTFNDNFHPTTAQAAVEVLEHAGFQVVVPMENMCCGRPLYDYGFLNEAKAWLQDILDKIRPHIRDGMPIVVLEPSCATVFREELCNLFPQDEDAARLSRQTFLLSEFLEKKADYQPPKLKRKAVVHGHCHHKAVMHMTDEETILKKMGLDYEVVDSGCCGMAGGFGFEAGEHYDISQKCGERVLLPKTRETDSHTLVVTDGFSCREQIKQNTERKGLHLAQVIQMALHEGEHGVGDAYPERSYVNAPITLADHLKTAAIVGAGALLIGGSIYLTMAKRAGRRSADQ